MRRIAMVAVWTASLCLLTVATPVSNAEPDAELRPSKRASKKSVRRCVKFSQKLGEDEASVDLSLTSKCNFDVICTMEWQLSCSQDDSSTQRSETRSTTLESTESWKVHASATVCEGDWEVQNVRWNCLAADA